MKKEKGPQDLAWGLTEAIPPEAPASWGARAILGPNGSVDLLHDRQDLWAKNPAEKKRLVGALNGGVISETRKASVRAFESHGLYILHGPVGVPRYAKGAATLDDERYQHSGSCEVVLYDDEVVTVVGNPRASCGYVYLAAWLKEA